MRFSNSLNVSLFQWHVIWKFNGWVKVLFPIRFEALSVNKLLNCTLSLVWVLAVIRLVLWSLFCAFRRRWNISHAVMTEENGCCMWFLQWKGYHLLICVDEEWNFFPTQLPSSQNLQFWKLTAWENVMSNCLAYVYPSVHMQIGWFCF